MTYKFNHVHIKANDPEAVANWYKGAFNFSIVSDTVRGFGDRFIRCQTEDGIVINISNERTGEKLPSGIDDPNCCIEHFGIEVDDMSAEISRLEGLGAVLKEGPIDNGNGMLIAFIACPQDVRIELMQLPS